MRSRHRHIFILLNLAITLIVASFSPHPAMACDMEGPPSDPNLAFDQAAAVFEGTLTHENHLYRSEPGSKIEDRFWQNPRIGPWLERVAQKRDARILDSLGIHREMYGTVMDFRVEKAWKGTRSRTLKVYNMFPGMCGINLNPGRYIVYAGKSLDGSFVVSLGSRVIPSPDI